jgi:RNA polymerase sigma-70 factor, ECF subfamily
MARQGRGAPLHRLHPGGLTLPDQLALAEVIRREGGRVVAALTRAFGDLDLAEDALQDATVSALQTWPRSGVPSNPGAWLTTAAKRSAIDRLRRESKRAPKERLALGDVRGGFEVAALDGRPAPAADFAGADTGGSAAGETDDSESSVGDDLLRLIFTCCHPSLAPEARVALALRTLCGLTTPEIAAAYLVPEATLAQRIVRAKAKIAKARIPYRVPADHELPERLPAVLLTVYLMFTEAHTSSSASSTIPVRVDLAEESIRLARLLDTLMPDEPECAGLLALLLATHARHRARFDPAGDPVLLEDQDRTLWSRPAIDEATSVLDRAVRRKRPGPYQIQAAISLLHDRAPTFAETDWEQIAALYRSLERHQRTPVVRVNRAVAEAFAESPERGLALLDTVEGMDGWHLLHAARGDLLRRMGLLAEAAASYRAALACECNPTDRRFLERRLAEVT